MSNTLPWVTIASGETFQLLLFARQDGEPTTYFIYQPQGNSPDPDVPSEDRKFTETTDFTVQINYSSGERLAFDVTVRKGLDGRLMFESDRAGGSF
jgi:hypothetical protein